MYKVTFANIVRYEKMYNGAGEFTGFNYEKMLEPPSIVFADVDEYRSWYRNPNNRDHFSRRFL